MAYMNKKKRYKLNRNTPKAQEGIASVGEWAEMVVDNIVDTVSDISLDFSSGSGKGSGKGSGSGGGEGESSGFTGTHALHIDQDTNFPGFNFSLPSGKKKLWKSSDNEARKFYGQFFDFDQNDKRRTPGNKQQISSASGRDKQWGDGWLGTGYEELDYTQKRSRDLPQGEATNSHPFSITEMILSLPPDVVADLKSVKYRPVPRSGSINDNAAHLKELGLTGTKKGDDSKYLKKIDPENRNYKRELKAYEDWVAGGRQKSIRRNHFKAMEEYYNILAPYFKDSGHNIEEVFRGIDGSQFGDLLDQQLSAPLVKDALAKMHPDHFNKYQPENGYYPSFQSREGKVGDLERKGMSKFIGAPMDFEENYRASFGDESLDDEYWTPQPSNEWKHIQYLYSQGAGEDGSGGNTREEILQMLADGQDKRIFGDRPVFAETFDHLPRDMRQGTVKYDKKEDKFYSNWTNDYLTPEQEADHRLFLANQYVDQSGWKDARMQGTEALPKKEIGLIPSGKTTGELPTPTGGPLTFTDEVGSFDDDITEVFTGDDTTGGETGGTGTKGPSRRETQSINAILTSVKNGTHIKTGEAYNEGDLRRDAGIIKSEFGADAHDRLMKDLISVQQPAANNTDANANLVQTSGADGDTDVNRRDFVGPRNLNYNQFGSGKDREEEERVSVKDSIQKMRDRYYGEDEVDDTDREKKQKEEKKQEEESETAEAAETTQTTEGGFGSGFGFFGGPSIEHQQMMMSEGQTPTYRNGGFSKDFDMNRMKFMNEGGFSNVASHFSPGGGGSGVSGGFNIAQIHDPTRRTGEVKDGEIYLGAKIMALENKIAELDPNDPANRSVLEKLNQELEECKTELAILKGMMQPPAAPPPTGGGTPPSGSGDGPEGPPMD